MQLPLLTQSSLVNRFAAMAQAKSAAVLNFAVGRVLRALAEAQAGVALYLQYLCILVLGQTRAATSEGADLDTFYADFFFTREPAVAATGIVSLSRNSATQPALVVPYVNADGSVNPSGGQLKTADGSQIFYITTDTTNAAWSTSAGAQPGYFVPAGTPSVSVPVVAATPGAAGNVQAGTITLSASNLVGIDNSTNPVAFTTGVNAEADDAFRARFRLYIAGLATGVDAAIIGAAENVQQGVKTQLRHNYPGPGFYTLYVDDGSGAAPGGFIAAVTAAVQAVTSEGVQPAVLRPALVGVDINVSIQLAAGAVRSAVEASVEAALATFVSSLGIGAALPYLQLPTVIFGADPAVSGIASLTVNGATADVTPGLGGLIQASNINVA